MGYLAGACRWARFAFAALEGTGKWKWERATNKTDNHENNHDNDLRIEDIEAQDDSTGFSQN